MERKRKRPQRRSRGLNVTVSKVERAIKGAGYIPHAIVPLLTLISVVGEKDEVIYNIRLDKKTFEIISIERLSYSYNKDKRIKDIFRTKI